MIHTAARTLARRLIPGVMADRARRYESDLRRRLGVTDLAERLVAAGGPVVRGGPFAGMRYPSGRLGEIDAAPAKLVGAYEREIAAVFERAIAAGVSTFVDVGCADGYYAVGMAHASPVTTVHAYDISASARDLCTSAARASGVDARVLVNRRFSTESLAAVPADGALLLCDIEGAELALFDADLVAKCAGTTVVIEVHEDDVPGAGDELTRRFAGSHEVTAVTQRAEPPEAALLPADWTAEERQLALAELRGPKLHWLICTPRASSDR